MNSPNRFVESKAGGIASIPRVRRGGGRKVNAGLTFWFFFVKKKEQVELNMKKLGMA